MIAAQIAELAGGCEGCAVVGVAGFWSALENGEGFFDLARCFVETLQGDEREREVGMGCGDLGVHAGKRGEKDERPLIKRHGFGVASLRLINLAHIIEQTRQRISLLAVFLEDLQRILVEHGGVRKIAGGAISGRGIDEGGGAGGRASEAHFCDEAHGERSHLEGILAAADAAIITNELV